MQVIYGISELPQFVNPVITIGSFDGYHQGHQSIVQKTCALAKEIGGQSVIVTFSPHPRSIIYPRDKTLRLLTTEAEKIRLIATSGADYLVVVPFSVEFSQLSADEYIVRFIVAKFHPRKIVIGYDHRFGLNRQGDINFLTWYGKDYGYEVVQLEETFANQDQVSSTRVRNAILEQKIEQANQLLGHPYTLEGVVVTGYQVGRSLGFPTANLQISDPLKLIPPDGIYAVYVFVGNEKYGGMLYIGNRPTLKGDHATSIEINLLHFDGALYNATLIVELVSFIRGDIEFDNLDQLKVQLQEDRNTISALLAQKPSEYMAHAQPA